ncbi:Inactive hydroxysteroid dehydrogenase-like protein 1 [Microtus ochrogaster]|uniref:Inactive hydroxysteroid dehydrogenase-like protein 1 n=1 Tax=Microtus ochrogaster TaxID=79684 RepID=A0A8J6FZ28_MICOH|nr:Inactive hydroxysteroid dehydrogenase-like protein 1 [Microtus ochrogaster]
MAAVDSFYLLYREIARSCNCYMEALALVGAWYTARKSITVICDFYSLIRLHFIPRLGSRPDLIKQYGRWAVISGATDGIGKAYAEELASRGLNMILIGQEEEKLQAVAKHIADTYRVETVVMVADFSRGREIYAPIREALRDRDIGILVNDVGAFYPYPQYFTQIPEDTLWDIVNVNIAAASLMVHIVLPGMVERRKGAIVTVSSGSCCKPTPQLAAFSASKAYLDHFSRALQYEYASKGIFVQSLIPFHVTTSVTTPGSFLHRCPWLAPSPRVYAQHAVSTLGISKRTTGYWSHSIQASKPAAAHHKTRCLPIARARSDLAPPQGRKCREISGPPHLWRPDVGSAHAGRGRAGHARPLLLSHLSGVVSRDLRVNIPRMESHGVLAAEAPFPSARRP